MPAAAPPTVLAIGKVYTASPEYAAFCRVFDVMHYDVTSEEEFIVRLGSDFRHIAAIWCDHLGLMTIGGMTDRILAALPPSLRVVCIGSIGFGEYQVERLQERGIAFFNLPQETLSSQVADVALYHVMNSFRHLSLTERVYREEGGLFQTRARIGGSLWDKASGTPLSIAKGSITYGNIIGGEVRSPAGKTALIVGFGAIGKALAKRLMVIGMKVSYVKRALDEEAARELAPFSDHPLTWFPTWEAATETAPDVVILSLPGSAANHHYINAQRLALLQHTRLVNVGRGVCVDTAAVVQALRDSTLLYFGADVLEEEPGVDPALLLRHDVSLTPHQGSSTTEAVIGASALCMANIKKVLL